ncbi:cobalt-zinc-cadmium efflux system protein [Tistlia consotensis]|uniref:Cobalt-zinc-cadmium efflux system protein n=1 Tax=Tistlia consotensis USBA 355 TaxID=560819 RepID=A0A1Y6CHX3_9PROT|nr:cation diffusion facilitator family transporter [Tistlia consotensis]SMF54134.1 cobalt-zinc-cadmium efflux system protein [Tistlia consotensis USBA 355]SNR86591.1 cobalt-zinc-cadmium efflux system protein [Tistlia consotensis]
MTPSHDHGHDHDHGAHDHSHVPDVGAGNEKRMAVAAALTGLFMLVEAGGGLVAGSLALLADAGHMLTDFAALLLAWFAFRVARRPADWKRTYGFDRFSVLVAFVNGIGLFVIAAVIAVEAVQRFRNPVPVLGDTMLVIAVAGLLVNLLSFWVLHGADKDNLNVRGAALHVLGDLLGSVAAIAAAVVILLTGWMPIDPLLSVLVVLLILRSAWYVVKESGRILLEAAPRGFDTRAVAADLVALEGIEDVHHLHAWSITEKRRMMTLHARIEPGSDGARNPERITAAIKARLKDRFGIAHATVEIEHDDCADAGDCGEATARRQEPATTA